MKQSPMWKKSKVTSKIQAPTAGGHFPLTRFYRGLSSFEASRHLPHDKSFLLGEPPVILMLIVLWGLKEDRAEALDQS